MYYFNQRCIQRQPREKFKRLKAPEYDYTKTGMLVTWLFLKYDLSFTDYENKTKRERKMLQEEFFSDTAEYRQDDIWLFKNHIEEFRKKNNIAKSDFDIRIIKEVEKYMNVRLPKQYVEYLQKNYGISKIYGNKLLGMKFDGSIRFAEETLSQRGFNFPEYYIVVENTFHFKSCLNCRNGNVVSWYSDETIFEPEFNCRKQPFYVYNDFNEYLSSLKERYKMMYFDNMDN